MQNTTHPSVSRREIVAGLGAALVLTACSSGAAPEQTAMDQGPAKAQAGQALATGNMDRWISMVGTEFSTSGVRLKVGGVQALPSVGARPPDATREAAFLVVFEILSGGGMPGDLIYPMTSSTHRLDVFLASAVTAEFPNRMHAVFN